MPALLTLSISDFSLQIIVVDGHSTDLTVAQLEELQDSMFNNYAVDLQIYRLPGDRERGWASQLKFALEKVSRAYYVFIHADTRLGPEWDEAVVRSLNQPGVVAGVFPYMACLPNHYVWLWLVRWGVYGHILNYLRWATSAQFAHSVGEQGFFTHAFFFRLMGGLEGVGLTALPGGLSAGRCCLRYGGLAVSGDPVSTLPRRWMRRSIVKGMVIEGLMVLARAVGVTPALRFQLYQRCPRLVREHIPHECG